MRIGRMTAIRILRSRRRSMVLTRIEYLYAKDAAASPIDGQGLG
jgi:hypothetical protein